MADNQQGLEELRARMDKYSAQSSWNLHFLRMHTDQADAQTGYNLEVTLHLYNANLGAAIGCSDLALAQLENLMKRRGVHVITDLIERLFSYTPEETPDRVPVIDHLASFPIAYDPRD